MSQANDLLEGLAEDVVEPSGEAGTATEGHIVIGRDRFITVPEELKKIAVQYDHNIETVTFDCPRYWDEHDLSKMRIYVNYLNADDRPGTCLCENVVVDETDSEVMHFDWTISGNVTMADGGLVFLVCAKTVDSEGNEEAHWNTELCTDAYVSKGLRCMDIILRRYPDIITQLLARMDNAEEAVLTAAKDAAESAAAVKTSEENARNAMNSAAASAESAKNAEASVADIKQSADLVHEAKDITVAAATTAKENADIAVDAADRAMNAAEIANSLIVVGPTKPSFDSLWFNTGSGDEPVVDPNAVMMSLVDEIDDSTVFAEIDETTYGVDNMTIGETATETKYNFNII